MARVVDEWPENDYKLRLEEIEDGAELFKLFAVREGQPRHDVTSDADAYARRIDQLLLAMTEIREERDALKMTVEEGGEIEAELSAALAVMAGDEGGLVPCAEGCPGHLGDKAAEAFKAALERWRQVQAERDALREELTDRSLEEVARAARSE